MKIPRDLNAADLIGVLCRHFSHNRVHQVGSHVILETDKPTHHRIAIPNHNPLRIGTLSSILNAVSAVKQIDKKEILRRL